MDVFGEKTKFFVRQIRYSWTLLTLVLIFVLVLWTFQLALIVRFQTAWPSGGTICFSDHQESEDDRALMDRVLGVSTHYSLISDPPRIVCYYVLNSTSTNNKLSINPFLCSHVIVGFAQVVNNTILPKFQRDLELYKDVVNLKVINPSLKVLISVQEYSGPEGQFAGLVSNQTNRKKFAKDVLNFLSSNSFDGLDIDWEFPAWPSPNPVQKKNFTLLLSDIYTNLKLNSPNYTLSVAVGAPAAIFLQSYDIADMAKYVDWVNLMSYDYHLYTKLTPTTGPNAPLYQRREDSTFLATLNTNWSAAHWLFWGMPKNKITIGIPTYGHSFKLLNADNTGWYAPSVGFGETGDKGFCLYQDACKLLSQVRATEVWDNNYMVPYAFKGSEWISYENIDSVRHKAELVVKEGYGGAMIFSLNTDDSEGLCKQGSYPLTSTVHSVLSSPSALSQWSMSRLPS